MDSSEIKTGDKVCKGMYIYTVISPPSNDVFKAVDDEGEIVVLYAGEVIQCSVGDE
jgi:hypothetical protein